MSNENTNTQTQANYDNELELTDEQLDEIAGGRASNTRAASRMRKYGAATVARVRAGLPAWLGTKSEPR